MKKNIVVLKEIGEYVDVFGGSVSRTDAFCRVTLVNRETLHAIAMNGEDDE
jgi:hypothetical protein